ncbi:MAG: acetyl-CoA carboxylase carboxyltransferase subunit alpha [Oligoflexales bacterium]
MQYIQLEKPIVVLEEQIQELRVQLREQKNDRNLDQKVNELELQLEGLRENVFSSLEPYETVQLARHPMRPRTLDYIEAMTSEFHELHGDRNYQDDKAIVGGLARIGSRSVMILGHQKGRDTSENIYRNFGMPRPEGYRKALRLMSLAERIRVPIVTLIDTPGAYPGVGAEERGQSEAIGKNIFVMSRLKVPILSVVIGEGGSGGALALGVANKVFMLQHSIYSVISPEGCASILFKSAERSADAANALGLNSESLLNLGVVDGVIEEPYGGAHRDPDAVMSKVKDLLLEELEGYDSMSDVEIKEQRAQRYLQMGSAGL